MPGTEATPLFCEKMAEVRVIRHYGKGFAHHKVYEQKDSVTLIARAVSATRSLTVDGTIGTLLYYSHCLHFSLGRVNVPFEAGQ